jgi:hypothetical protein
LRSLDFVRGADGWVARGTAHTAVVRTGGLQLSVDSPLAAPATFSVRTASASPETDEGARLVAGTSVVLARGDLVETFTNRPGGVEQSWRFSAAPPRGGELRVVVEVSGAAYVGATDHGLHFRSPTSALGLRYGVATWIDARGVRTVIRPELEQGRIEIAVPRAVLASSTFPAVLDPMIEPELGLDLPLAAAEVSFDGGDLTATSTGHVMVWSVPHETVAGRRRVLLAHLDTAGKVAAPGVFEIMSLDTAAAEPRVATDGTSFLVVARESAASGSRIVAMPVSAAGAPLSASPVPVTPGSASDTAPAVGHDGTSYVVAWQRNTGPWWSDTILARRLDASGAPLDADPIQLASAGRAQGPQVASHPGATFVVWRHDPLSGTPPMVSGVGFQLRGAVLLPSGAVQPPGEMTIDATANRTALSADVASDGSGWCGRTPATAHRTAGSTRRV